jgi:hypothetical protein
MVRLYGKNYTRKELLRHIGRIGQVGGARAFEFIEGAARGMVGVDVRSGSGLNYTVLPGRGLDISDLEYKGIPLAWRSCSGDRHPTFYEPEGFRWVRTFGGGALVTCGLDQIGTPGEEAGEEYGLHGRYSATPAERFHCDEEWRGNDCIVFVEGRVRQACLFRENLLLERRIETPLGEDRILIHDRVENAGGRPQVHMILYHCNFGFPLIDQGTRLYASAEAIVPRDDEAARGLDRAMIMEAPERREEQCYFYTMNPRKGWVEVALANRKLGIGVLLRYRADTLPSFTQWKCLANGDYVVGLEPSNCDLLGRVEARRQKKLVVLRPGEIVDYELKLQILAGKKAIDEAVERIG